MALYSCDEDGTLTDDIGEAVYRYLDDVDPAQWSRSTQVFLFERDKVEEPTKQYLRGRALDQLLEDLDEDHGDPDKGTVPTDEMKELAREYVEKLCGLYHVWRCSNVGFILVDLLDYVHEREFLDKGDMEAIESVRRMKAESAPPTEEFQEALRARDIKKLGHAIEKYRAVGLKYNDIYKLAVQVKPKLDEAAWDSILYEVDEEG